VRNRNKSTNLVLLLLGALLPKTTFQKLFSPLEKRVFDPISILEC